MKCWKVSFQWSVLLISAVIYALLYALCSQIDVSGTVASVGYTSTKFVCAFPLALAAVYILFRVVMPRACFSKNKEGGAHFCTWFAAAFLFACYVPMFLVVYPGSFTYDSMTQIAQIASGKYDAFHPLLHTLLIRACLSLYDVFESMEKCGAVYSLIQMICVSCTFAYICGSISRCVSRGAARVALAFFALYPSHFAFASNCTKDVLFSASLALFVALCWEEIVCGLSRKKRFIRLAAATLACLLRNNMIYAMAVWAAVLLFTGKRMRRIALCGALSVVLAWGTNAALQHVLDADDGNVREMLSLPLQMLARARNVAPETFEPEELVYFDELIRDQAYLTYTPTISDNVKNALNEELFLEAPIRFFALWASVGAKCPEIYLDAFLNQTYPSLYPYGRYMHNYAYIDIGSGRALTAPFALEPLQPPARFASAYKWLHENLFKNGADNHPVLRWIFNTGLLFWILLAHALYAVYCKDVVRVQMFLLPILLWGTYLLGPIMYGRYLYPFVCMMPLYVLRSKAREA